MGVSKRSVNALGELLDEWKKREGWRDDRMRRMSLHVSPVFSIMEYLLWLQNKQGELRMCVEPFPAICVSWTKEKKILFCHLVILWVRRVLRIPPHMWSTVPTTLLRQAASLLGLVMLQTRVKNHPILLELLRAGSRKQLQQSQISPFKIGLVPGGFQQDLFHLLSSSLFPTCDYTTCNNNVDTRKMNKKIWFRSKTLCDALCTIHLSFID